MSAGCAGLGGFLLYNLNLTGTLTACSFGKINVYTMTNSVVTILPVSEGEINVYAIATGDVLVYPVATGTISICPAE